MGLSIDNLCPSCASLIKVMAKSGNKVAIEVIATPALTAVLDDECSYLLKSETIAAVRLAFEQFDL